MRLFNTTSSWKKEWKRTTTWSQTSTLFLPYVKRDVNGPPWGESDPHDFAVEGIWRRSTDSWGFLRAGVPPARDALSHGKDDSSHHGCVGRWTLLQWIREDAPSTLCYKDCVLHYTEFLFSLLSVTVPCLCSPSLRKGKGLIQRGNASVASALGNSWLPCGKWLTLVQGQPHDNDSCLKGIIPSPCGQYSHRSSLPLIYDGSSQEQFVRGVKHFSLVEKWWSLDTLTRK